MNKESIREKKIVKTSIVGIVANVFLATFKAIVGLLSNSIAITLDAINNLSDALSSIITIVGTKLALKSPDKKHPYGYRRIEYISALVISIIVLYAGITSFIESVKKIITPEQPDYSIISLVIISVAIIVKIILGIYVKKIGKEVKSESLIDSGSDALNDSIISFSTLIAAIIYISLKISIEAWLGTIISIIIIKSGIEMVKSTISQILGERIEPELSKRIKTAICKYEEVHGAFDLVLNNYGPDFYIGSIHIEVDDKLTASEIDELTRRIMKDIYKKENVIISAVGIYSINTKDKEAIKIRNDISKIVHEYKSVIQMHGFYINNKEKTISFDIIIDYDEHNKKEIYNEIKKRVKDKYKDYSIQITLDFDVSE